MDFNQIINCRAKTLYFFCVSEKKSNRIRWIQSCLNYVHDIVSDTRQKYFRAHVEYE
jgi:hypothetical protein